ncbi:MAG: phosphate ABC transporter permease PstA [Actinomycetota bacterium]|jgi:phosphate transport system permease protein|nr:phosphate ABC transporter permease PstA [Actinomycetota bacterium]
MSITSSTASLPQRDSIRGAPPAGERAFSIAFSAMLALGLFVALGGLAAILIWAISAGLPRLDWGLFTNAPSTARIETAGFRTAILGSLYVIAGVIALIIPIGLGTALYLEEFSVRTSRFARLVDLNIQNLAGVPAIVFGILGLAFIVRGPLDLGFVAAAASMTLALLVLPTIIVSSREAIRGVPRSLKEGALALGATPWKAVWTQVVPYAAPGVLTGAILSVARAIGEAAPLLLVGAVTFVTFNPRFWSDGYSVLPVMIYQYATRPQASFRLLAFAGVLVMLVLVLFMNSFAIWLRNRYERPLQ